MLIINADDYGRSRACTDSSLQCFGRGRITSASAMVFMTDSRRAAESALEAGLDTGLHLNLDLPFDGLEIPHQVGSRHARLVRYFRCGRWSHFVYDPFIKNDLDYVFQAQYEEYGRLFAREPAQVDGHQHVHLSANVLMDRVIPSGLCVRRHFTFRPGEKSLINRSYRRLVDRWLTHRYICTDAFFSIEPLHDVPRIARIISLAYSSNVELMVHPSEAEQCRFLLSPQFGELIGDVAQGTYRLLAPERARGGSRR